MEEDWANDESKDLGWNQGYLLFAVQVTLGKTLNLSKPDKRKGLDYRDSPSTILAKYIQRVYPNSNVKLYLTVLMLLCVLCSQGSVYVFNPISVHNPGLIFFSGRQLNVEGVLVF